MQRKWTNTGELIKSHRLKQGISQKELTTRVIGESKHGQFFWNIEAGKAGLPPKHLFKTSQILMCSLQLLKEAMIKDYKENLDDMIRVELDKLTTVHKAPATPFIPLDHHE